MAGGLSARFGGEEFVGACKNLSFEENERLADRIRQRIYDLNIEHASVSIGRITVSVGVSYAEADESTTRTEMMRLADRLLYEAKNSGKNKVIISRLNKE